MPMIWALGSLVLVCIFLQAYHFVLYPIGIALAARMAPVRRAAGAEGGSVSLIISALNERGIIVKKLENSVSLEPPPLEIIVVADGSDDGTETVAEAFESVQIPVKVLFDPVRRGKASAMQRGVEASSGELLLFSDANAIYGKNAIEAIRLGFDRESVVVVSGVKHVLARGATDKDGVAVSDGVYWRIEKRLRVDETRLGCTVAVVGEILALRREAWRPIPKAVVNDDAWIAMSAICHGGDVICAPDAESWEEASPSGPEEFKRRRRINAGRLKLVMDREVWPLQRLWPLFAFVSHKVLRLFLPFLFMIGLVAASAVALATGSIFFGTLVVLHLIALSVGLIGMTGVAPFGTWIGARVAAHILRAYLAAALAFFDVLKGRDFVLWEKIAR
ncbi:glycosyltransferase [Silicimonas sp. MF1-12-2]|uniref:glycosyltransferase n=1 Tax=Silicimonas sp. MF1-12-2 TaxID=3384793 RepID=UPI0039B681F7